MKIKVKALSALLDKELFTGREHLGLSLPLEHQAAQPLPSAISLLRHPVAASLVANKHTKTMLRSSPLLSVSLT